MSDENEPNQPPPVQQDFSQPPAVQQAYQYQQAPSPTRNIIPTENPPALLAYYMAIFGLIPGFCLILGPAALVLGIVGLNKIKAQPSLPGKVHAWIGVVLGGLISLACLAFIILIIYASQQKPS